MKTSTKRKAISKEQYEKDSSYAEGYNDGAKEQAEVFATTYKDEPDALQTAKDIKEWDRNSDFSFTCSQKLLMVAVAILLGVVVGMILITPKVLEMCTL